MIIVIFTFVFSYAHHAYAIGEANIKDGPLQGDDITFTPPDADQLMKTTPLINNGLPNGNDAVTIYPKDATDQASFFDELAPLTAVEPTGKVTTI